MSLSDKPSMEGFLEKHSTGVSRLLGRNRFWCTLQGSCLVYCKESKRSSVVESLMLGDAQMVRKTSNDRHGLQFEVVLKKQKTHVFSAATAEECSSWVRHLQQAMIHNEPGTRRSHIRSQLGSNSGYEEITIESDSNPSIGHQTSLRKQISVPQSGIYSDVADALRPKSEGFALRNLSNPSNSLYAEVADVIRPEKPAADCKLEKPKSDESVDTTDVTRREASSSSDTEEVVYRENSLYVTNKKKEMEQMQPNDSDDMAKGYSTLDALCGVNMKAEASPVKGKDDDDDDDDNDASWVEDNGRVSPANGPVYAKVNKQKSNHKEMAQPPTDTDDCIYANLGDEVREGAAIEDLDNELKRLPEASSAPVWSPLTADDRKPLEDLKEFLANNRHLWRSSYVRQTSEGDPFVEVKAIIQGIH